MHLFTVKFDAAATDADQLLDNVDENVVMKALDGFLLILSNDGDVIYVSENIQEYIGIQQVCNRMIFRFFSSKIGNLWHFLSILQIEIIGNPIWDYTHQCDHSELRDALKAHNEDQQNVSESLQRNIMIRIKCTLTSRGRSVNIKSATYKVSALPFVSNMYPYFSIKKVIFKWEKEISN